MFSIINIYVLLSFLFVNQFFYIITVRLPRFYVYKMKLKSVDFFNIYKLLIEFNLSVNLQKQSLDSTSVLHNCYIKSPFSKKPKK